MPDSARRPPKVVPLDADKLGHIAAAWGAFAVALTQMFLREATLLTTLVRSGWTYVGVYAATFILVRMFLRASLFQMLADRRERREGRRRLMKERQEAAKPKGPAGLEASALGMESEPGTPPPSETGLPSL
jgi:hypothetical protein